MNEIGNKIGRARAEILFFISGRAGLGPKFQFPLSGRARLGHKFQFPFRAEPGPGQNLFSSLRGRLGQDFSNAGPGRTWSEKSVSVSQNSTTPYSSFVVSRLYRHEIDFFFRYFLFFHFLTLSNKVEKCLCIWFVCLSVCLSTL